MIARIVAGLSILLAVYAVYLGGRIMIERRDVSARVDDIIAAADPADLVLTPARTAMLLRVEDPTFRTN